MSVLAGKRILVTGGSGFLGKPVCRQLSERGAAEIIVPRSAQFDLTQPAAVRELLDQSAPEIVIHLAAEVGGIGANRAQPGRFFYANMAMGLHLIEELRARGGIEKFVQVGTVCSYPRLTPVPFREEALWDGYPEVTNAPYGIAKKALFVMLQAYREQYGFPGICLLPVNLYGPGDNFALESSHVIPALIRKCEEAIASSAEAITCWGTGRASREFLYVDDCAEAIAMAADRYDGPQPVNVGIGAEITIRALASLVAALCGFEGEIRWDSTQPDGQPRRSLDTSRAAALFGFRASTRLKDGLHAAIDSYRAAAVNPASVRT